MLARVQIHRVMQYPAETTLPDGGWLQVSRVFLSVTAAGNVFNHCTIDAHQAMTVNGPRGPLVLSPVRPDGVPWDPDVCRTHVLAYLKGAQAMMFPEGLRSPTPGSGHLLVRETVFRFAWPVVPGSP